MSEAGEVLQTLDEHHDHKIGYVLYRCVYGDDEEWRQFMEQMTAYVNVSLDLIEDGEKLKENFAWIVQEDATSLDGASKHEVARQFKNWATSVDGHRGLTKYQCCIFVDREVMTAVMNGDDPISEEEILDPTAYVKLINQDYTGPSSTIFEGEDGVELGAEAEAEGDEEGDEDENYPAVEGDRRYDVQWMKVSPCMLVPRWYTLLKFGGWSSYFSRPPKIAKW